MSQEPNVEVAISRGVPLFLRIGVFLIFFGAFFPIYGFTFESMGKLTVYRIGLAVMLLAVPLGLYRGEFLRNLYRRLTLCLLAFIFLRVLSLSFSTDIALSVGYRMVEWFIESTLGAYCVACATQRYPTLLKSMLRLFFFVGGMEVLVMAVQFLQMRTSGKIFALPLSMTAFGVKDMLNLEESLIYPIGPGWRVVGGFLESNVAGSFIAMMSVFGIALSSAGKSRWAINGGRIIFVLSLVALWGNGSRQALFYVPIGIGVCLLAQLLYRQRMSRFFLVIVIVFIASWLYSHYLVSPDYSLTEAVEDSGELGSRLARALEGEGLLALGGRKFACEDLISSLGWNNLLLGFGEGYGHDVGVGLGMLVSCHNAYLIVLLENGALAFLLLCFISIEMFIGTCRIPTSLFPGFSSEIELYRIVLPGWVVIWICSIFVNWTQMNMAACWPFLAVAIAVIYKKGDGSGHKARLMAV